MHDSPGLGVVISILKITFLSPFGSACTLKKISIQYFAIHIPLLSTDSMTSFVALLSPLV